VPTYPGLKMSLKAASFLLARPTCHGVSSNDSYGKSEFAPLADARTPLLTRRIQFLPPDNTAIVSNLQGSRNFGVHVSKIAR